jgi:hypothetical protein
MAANLVRDGYAVIIATERAAVPELGGAADRKPLAIPLLGNPEPGYD